MSTDERIAAQLRAAAADVDADEAVLDDLRRRAAGRRRGRRFGVGAVVLGAAAAVVALALVVLPDDDDGGERVDMVAPPETSTTLSTTSEGPSTTVPRTIAVPETDWEGERFDLGVVKEVQSTGGRWFVVFDRIQLEGDGPDQWKSGSQFSEEPVLCCHSDAMTRNDNPALRTYEVSPAVEVVVLANKPHTCPGEEPEYGQEPQWASKRLDEVARTRDWATWDGVALTFDRQGIVTRIRLTGGC